MPKSLILPLEFACALGSGLAGGVFFAFSTFVMAGLARLAPAEGISAMHAINVTAVTPLFMTLLFGTALLCLLAIATLPWRWNEPGAVAVLLGGAVYVFGAAIVTMIWNVPLNNALAAVTSTDPASAATWAGYLRDWVLWNHVRTVTCAAGSALFILAIWQQARA